MQPTLLVRLAALWATFMSWLAGPKAGGAAPLFASRRDRLMAARFVRDDAAAFNLAPMLNIAFVVIGVFVGLAVIAALIEPFFDNVEAVNENLTDASTGSTVADDILDIFPIIVGLAAAVGLVLLILKLFDKF